MVTNDRQLNTIYITTEKTFNKYIYIYLLYLCPIYFETRINVHNSNRQRLSFTHLSSQFYKVLSIERILNVSMQTNNNRSK